MTIQVNQTISTYNADDGIVVYNQVEKHTYLLPQDLSQVFGVLLYLAEQNSAELIYADCFAYYQKQYNLEQEHFDTALEQLSDLNIVNSVSH